MNQIIAPDKQSQSLRPNYSIGTPSCLEQAYHQHLVRLGPPTVRSTYGASFNTRWRSDLAAGEQTPRPGDPKSPVDH